MTSPKTTWKKSTSATIRREITFQDTLVSIPDDHYSDETWRRCLEEAMRRKEGNLEKCKQYGFASNSDVKFIGKGSHGPKT